MSRQAAGPEGPALALALARALETRKARLPGGTDAFRWVDGELEGWTVDLFADVAVASTYRARPAEEERAFALALAAVAPLRSVYLKRRPREARRAASLDAARVAPPLPLWGTPVERLAVEEDGARFEIRPANGLSVGLYLDARDARAWVRRHAAGRSVLNLFAYTCGFGVAALRGGAARAVNLDLSRKVLDWGERNTRANGYPTHRQDFISGDALEWLPRLAKKGERFDLVVLDPPSFASVGKRRFSAGADYARLALAAAACVAPEGELLACCNLEQWSARDFAARVREGLVASGRRLGLGEGFGASSVDHRQPSALKVLPVGLA